MPQICPVTFVSGTGARRFDITVGGQVVLGRSKRADLTVNSPRLSRMHCAVRLTNQGMHLEDLGSSNGTFVNGQRVSKVVLRPRDIIQLGGIAIRVDFDPASLQQQDMRCERCGRMVSMAHCEDGQVFELGSQFVCAECAHTLQHQSLNQTEQMLVAVLREEGYEVEGKTPLSSALIPVFKARRMGLDTTCAVKALPLLAGVSKKKIERFKKEAKSAARVRHPNVIEIFDIRQAHKLLYIVMEHVEGELLLTQIERKGALHAKAAAKIGLLVCRALGTAHKQGIVHRDLKPGGIMIDQDGAPKVADFGLAKDLWSITGDITGPEETLGTVRYMPPEQVKNARSADHRADLYSLGAMLFHCLTGKPPYWDRPELALMGDVLSGTLEPFDPTDSDLPSDIARILARAMQPNPDKRYQDAKEFEDALGDYIVSLVDVPGFKGDPLLLLSLEESGGPLDTTWRGPTPPSAGGMAGFFGKHELVEFLQMIETNTKSGMLSVKWDDDEGHLAFQDGRLRAAVTKTGQRGESAVSTILDVRSGQFEFKPTLPDGFKATLNMGVSSLLLEALRRMDEAEAEETT
jgi:serine/threonine-protein kinase